MLPCSFSVCLVAQALYLLLRSRLRRESLSDLEPAGRRRQESLSAQPDMDAKATDP